ncbi:NAD(P)/FAD-dependent oxidoreductase [Algoriphagus halophilus]|uniref:3-phenylpropionate/trans-cinnamate dioxygenase ferredoxin reductase subunit n=1 Tax=Algoriphagus halophilus TaxID=226505 RepID=A0A1N6FPX1_9BACT|nr:FAD-dependent oxidoreductase [Algoriphagus halophilus]SIN97273.1 3-phenylpropionate/trans-cinnamate dioxygenase ferredoxin reductase subunit [Algoriphagus halophilus]
MSENLGKNQICLIIGASHAGVNCAFALRKEGWEGKIILLDSDPELPYHRPPLSKTYLYNAEAIGLNLLKSAESYAKENIQLLLKIRALRIDRKTQIVQLDNGTWQAYDKLVLATGARAMIPSIPGLSEAKHVYPLRTAADINEIRNKISQNFSQEVVIIGGGYIGLEIAASLRKLEAKVTVLERESRVLARVTAPELSLFFENLHAENGVFIHCNKQVTAIKGGSEKTQIICADGSSFSADMLVLGVGIQVNSELASASGLEMENGIRVDLTTLTSDEHIYAIGDCTNHFNPHYQRYLRLECVQNAVDQAKIAAAAICSKDVFYDTIPWFWSDQYEVKFQMVGLSTGYEEVILRKESEKVFSIWYFKGNELLAVDAVNSAKAYVWGTKFIKSGEQIDKAKLKNSEVELKSIGK